MTADAKILTPELQALADNNPELLRVLAADAAGERLDGIDTFKFLEHVLAQNPDVLELHYRLLELASTRARYDLLDTAVKNFSTAFAALSEEQRRPYYGIIHLNLIPSLYFLGDGAAAKQLLADIPEDYYAANETAQRRRQYVECMDMVSDGMALKPMAYCHLNWQADDPILLPREHDGKLLIEAWSLYVDVIDADAFLRDYALTNGDSGLSASPRQEPMAPSRDNIIIAFKTAKYGDAPDSYTLSLSLNELEAACDELPEALRWTPEQAESKNLTEKFAEMGVYGEAHGDENVELIRFFAEDDGVLDIGPIHLDNMRYLKTSEWIVDA